MADGYARAGGDVGVALTVPGPGASNASTGLLQAYTDCVPVLLITGQHESRHYGRDPAKLFHGLDQMSFFRADHPLPGDRPRRRRHPPRRGGGLPRPAGAAAGAGDAGVPPGRDHRAGRGRGRSAPGALPLRRDSRRGAAGRGGPEPGRRLAPPDPGRQRRDHGRSPGAVAGPGREAPGPGGGDRRGKGALPEDHELALLDIRGYLARQAVEAADCTLARGLPLHLHRHEPVGMPVPAAPDPARSRGPPRSAASTTATSGSPGTCGRAWRACANRCPGAAASGCRCWRAGGGGSRPQPPLPLLPEIREVLPDDGILSVDVHGIGYSAFAEYPVRDPETFLYPCIGVSLGHAFPAALGPGWRGPAGPWSASPGTAASSWAASSWPRPCATGST